MISLQELLQFPAQLRRARHHRASSQKALALELGLDQAFFCGVEKGRRPPFNDHLIARLSEALSLSDQTAHLLAWSAKHDRFVRCAWDATKSQEDVVLVSQLLCTSSQLNSAQRQGLRQYLESVRISAGQLESLTSDLATSSGPKGGQR